PGAGRGSRAPAARRELTVAVLGCLAGAGLAFLAGNQDWALRVTRRQPPLSPLRESFSGADLAAWLPGVALVALAAAVAFFATRAWGRTLVGVTAIGSGTAIVAGAIAGLVLAGAEGRTVLGAGLWPVACGLGGLLVLGAGVLTVRRGRSWPAMGARYQRPEAEPARQPSGDDSSQLWDAIDSGSDPTDPGR
ncbi:MAG: Trp biosynthesis-associated membrane protein, partial [Micromonosporaceae bacterium]